MNRHHTSNTTTHNATWTYAVPYRRFSTDRQSKGDSTSRQSREFTAFCGRHNLEPLDWSVNDDGQSAFMGKNAREGALGEFLRQAESGKVPVGTVLVVENQDRLSRNNVMPTLQLFTRLVEAGVAIGDALADQIYTRDSLNDTSKLLVVILGAQRAYEYSLSLSKRAKSSWQAKRARAVSGEKLTGNCPFWLRLADDRRSYVVREEGALIVRRIFSEAANGYGSHEIARRLTLDGVASPRGKNWSPPNIVHLIQSRAVLGEFQPHVYSDGRRKPTGDPLPGYFPAVVDSETFTRANTLVGSPQLRRKGRQGQNVNVFQGILWSARTGLPYHLAHARGSKRNGVYSPTKLKLRSEYVTTGIPDELDYSWFLKKFLQHVSEVDLSDTADTTSRLRERQLTLSAGVAECDHKLTELRGRIAAGTSADVSFLLDLAESVATHKQTLVEELRQVEAELSTPSSRTLADLRSLTSAVDVDPVTLRGKVRLLISAIWALPSNVGDDKRERLVVVQVNYRSGLVRKYWFSYRATKGSKPGTIDYTSTVLMEGVNPSEDLELWRHHNTSEGSVDTAKRARKKKV